MHGEIYADLMCAQIGYSLGSHLAPQIKNAARQGGFTAAILCTHFQCSLQGLQASTTFDSVGGLVPNHWLRLKIG